MNLGVYYNLFSCFTSNIEDYVIFFLFAIVIWNGFYQIDMLNYVFTIKL